MDRELKRGTLELVLLKLLGEREMYGYEILSAVEARTGGRVEVKDGTLYPVLYRLEKAGYVEPYWQTQERGVPRKYYRITDSGRAELERRLEDWSTFIAAVSRLLDAKEGGS
jgi:PadR family transcriptional regulator, regulatory protein PadR